MQNEKILKPGDNIICIKNQKNFIKNKTYKILHLSYTNNPILVGYKIKGENSNTNFSFSVFDSYFITLKEIRKQKLKKLYIL